MEIPYTTYVDMGKKLVEKISAHKVQVCKYALAVCEIRNGGPSDDYYTLGNYADDIGIKRKTLTNWVEIYRSVVVKLGKDIKTNEDWQSARTAHESLRLETTIENKKDLTKNKRRTMDLPKEKVQQKYDEINNGKKPVALEIHRCTKSAKTILHTVKERDLSEIEDKTLTYLMETLDNASDLINDYLTEKLRNKAV